MPSVLGIKIRELRRAQDLTLEQLAQRTESSKSYIWELENKDVSRPSAEKLNRIAAVLGVTPEYLADEGRTDPIAGVRDEAFYRKYQGAAPEVKDKIKRILDLLDE